LPGGVLHRIRFVNLAIDLDDQERLGAIEVHDETAEGVLGPESEAERT
jgi:hypothetical protein